LGRTYRRRLVGTSSRLFDAVHRDDATGASASSGGSPVLRPSTPAAVDQRSPGRVQPDLAVDRKSLGRRPPPSAGAAATSDGAGDADEDEDERNTRSAGGGHDDDRQRDRTRDARSRTTVLHDHRIINVPTAQSSPATSL